MDLRHIVYVIIPILLIKIQKTVCTSQVPSYGLFLSTKTPYRFIENLDDNVINYEGCTPRRIWSVYRHGTRTPGRKLKNAVFDRLVKIQDAIVQRLSDSELRKWSPHYELDDTKRLTAEGEIEMEELGVRVKKRFPSIIPNEWTNDTFLFRATDTLRSRASLKYFTIGMFGKKEAERIQIPAPLKRDPILRFYKFCPRWQTEVKKGSKTLNEVDKFMAMPVFTTFVANVTNRLGLPEGYLSGNDVQIMYSVCAFETAWDKKEDSPWCKIFSDEEFKILEYIEDMEYFAIDGSAHEITTKVACSIFGDAIAHLDGDGKNSAVFYYTHSGTILKFLSHLDLYRDALDPNAENFFKLNDRLWRSSKIDAFASNIAFVRFDCKDDKRYILTLHQERPIKLPGCPTDSDLCLLDSVKAHYKDHLSDCDLEKLCSEEKTFLEYIKDAFSRIGGVPRSTYKYFLKILKVAYSFVGDISWKIYKYFFKLYTLR